MVSSVVDQNASLVSRAHVTFHVPSSSSSATSIESASGNRGVILHSYGAGFLRRTKSQHSGLGVAWGLKGIQNHSVIHEGVRINGYFLPILITSSFEGRRPQCRGDVDEQRLVGDMFPHATAPPETIRAVPFLARPRRTRHNLATRVQEPLGSEHRGVVAIGGRVVVAMPEIRKAQRSLGDEHPIVPVVFR